MLWSRFLFSFFPHIFIVIYIPTTYWKLLHFCLLAFGFPLTNFLTLLSSLNFQSTCAICPGTMKPSCTLNRRVFTHLECEARQSCMPCLQGNGRGSPERASSRKVPSKSSKPGRYMTILRRLPRVDSSNRHHNLAPLFHTSEPSTFDDDEPPQHQIAQGQ